METLNTSPDRMSSAWDSDGQAENSHRKTAGACSSCHRRKLKCDRMPVCSNCRKADIPCVYTPQHSKSKNIPTTRDGRKKPRGPYKKGQTVREKELEHLVEILQEKCTVLEAQVSSPTYTSPGSSHGSINVRTAIEKQQQDARRPLTKDKSSTDIIHPSQGAICQLWLTYTSKIDPVTKAIHCPSTSSIIAKASQNPNDLDPETNALLFAIYTTCLNALTPEEIASHFGGRSKDAVLSLYGNELVSILMTADEQERMTFKLLQALVLYMGCLRRLPGEGTNVKMLFTLAARSARKLGLDDPARYVGLRPLEVELRRRLWWLICRYENVHAEELYTRSHSLASDTDAEVPLPLNFEDYDLDPDMTVYPSPRAGITSMSVMLMMFEVIKLVGRQLAKLLSLRGKGVVETYDAESIKWLKEQSKSAVEDTRRHIETGILEFCDPLRPWDWFILLCTKIVLTKAEIMMLECPPETEIVAFNSFHNMKVALSLDIIECHQIMLKEKSLSTWNWNYRNSQQWYATTYVLEEVARRPDAAFEARVWRVVDVVFADMELLNKHGMKSDDRRKLLEAHGRAIEARERWLDGGSAVMRELDQQLQGSGENPGNSTMAHADTVVDEAAILKPQPWQMDQSLFDVPEAELAMFADDFFWPT